ncbi:MAG: nucleoside phosphorylase [Deltaproteobacteria bacterium]|nr:nucleoside phosphorylase [Deltaproteobacteria bacterium]
MGTFESAEVVRTKEGRQYHIGAGPRDVASTILLCGDPARAHRVATYLTDTAKPITHREYVTITGKYRGHPVTVMATGMGPDNTEIAVVELAQLAPACTLIRIGSSGGLMQGIEIGSLVISTGAVRLENTSAAYVIDGYPAVAHIEVTLALMEAANRLGVKTTTGLTATAPGFYAPQARKVPGFPVRDPELPERLDAMKVVNFEMESSVLFTLGHLCGARAGTVCAVVNNRHQNRFISEEEMHTAEQRCIEVGLGAVEILAAMDARRGRAPIWLPSMGL